MAVEGLFLNNTNSVCVFKCLSWRGTNYVMPVLKAFIMISERLRESVKLQAQHTKTVKLYMCQATQNISAVVLQSYTTRYRCLQGLAPVTTEASAITFSFSSDIIPQNTRIYFLWPVLVQFIQE